MNILFLIDGLGLGGKERQLLELIKQMRASKSAEIALVVLSKNVHYQAVAELDIETHFIERRTKKDLRAFFKILRIARRFQPDIIHSWELMCSIYAVPVAKLTGSAFVNGFIRRAPQNPSLRRAWLTYPCSDKILSNSFAGLKSYRVPAGKAVCIHNGFDFQRTARLESVDAIRAKFNLPKEKVVGMVARFHPRKHYQTFFQAAQEILKQDKEVTFVAVGDGETLERCRQSIDAELAGRVRFLGRQQDVESIIACFDVGVLTSSDEGISNVIMEYMAQEKPVVATAHGGNAELVIDGETGFLVPLHDSAEVAKRIIDLLKDPALATRLGHAGKSRLRTDFGIKKMFQSYLELYSNLLKKNAKLANKQSPSGS